LCDRIIIINDGQVIASGTLDDLKNQSGCDTLEDAFMKLIEPTSPSSQEIAV